MPGIVIALFAVVLGSFLGFFLVANRFLEKRDTTKIRDRLLERAPTERREAGNQPLFRPEEK
jgi:hypothetical protein